MKLRKLFAAGLALVMTLAMAAPAFADGEEEGATNEPAKVTIKSEANEDATYAAYKLLDLKTSLKDPDPEEGHTHIDTCYNYSYTMNAKYKDIVMAVAGVTEKADGKTMDQTVFDKLKEMGGRDLAEAFYDKISAADPALTADASLTQGTAEGLDQGYWLIVDTSAKVEGVYKSLAILDTAGHRSIEIKAKDETVTVDKKVNGKDTYVTSDIGKTVTYTLNSKLPANLAEYDKFTFKFVDTMDDGLTFTGISSVKVGDTTLSDTDYTTSGFFAEGAETKNGTGTIELSTYVTANLSTLASETIVVTYTAVVNDNAVSRVAENNKVHVVYSNDYHDETSYEKTPDDDVDVYTFSAEVFKYTGDKQALAGAHFALYKYVDNTKNYAAVDTTSGKISGWVAETETDVVPSGAADFVSPADGRFTIEGLDVGTYYLLETEAPEGYNLLADAVPFVIEDKAANNDDAPSVEIPYTEVENSTGPELPSTGGMGTTLFYLVGGLMVVAAGVLLVTKKRMENK